ncbi:transposase InsO family protein [Sphingosinicella soli]|uniref:Transposase InsO family protein n=1 Tax=Sphingosinicella soli TaxID=333708 RepID=A0A7W7F6T2_9SPHN|nr:transposase InsO family protein [Sphingosinicella soli]
MKQIDGSSRHRARVGAGAVLDLATRKIVGWAMRDPMRVEMPKANRP